MKLLLQTTRKPRSSRASAQRLGMTLAFGALIFGGSYGALAKGLTEYLSPISLLLVSEGLTALFLVFTLGLLPLCKALRKLKRSHVLWAATVGLLNSALAPFLWFTGLKYTTAVNASILTGADILFMLLFGWILLRERINRWQGLGAVIVLGGILVLNGTGPTIALKPGDALILTGVGVFALGAILFKLKLSKISAEVAIFIRSLTGMLSILAVSIFVSHPFLVEIATFPREQVILLLAFAFFSRYLHLTFFYEALDRLPAVRLGLIENAMPLSGVIFAVVLLGESLSTNQVLGAVLIIFGLVLEQMAKDAPARVTAPARLRLGHAPR